MKVSMLTGVVAGVVIATAGSAFGGYHLYQSAHSADVVSVKPVSRTIKVARQDCHNEAVTHQQPVKDHDRLLGTGLGALAGGVLGHQIGGGNGNTIATIAGAAAGGYAGNKIQQRAQQRDTYTADEQRCATVYDKKQEPAGFDVIYTYNGHEHHVHTDREPGKTLPVKDGKVNLEALNT